MNWQYDPSDFDLKLDAQGKPDIQKQNEANARIWFETLTKRLSLTEGQQAFQTEHTIRTEHKIQTDHTIQTKHTIRTKHTMQTAATIQTAATMQVQHMRQAQDTLKEQQDLLLRNLCALSMSTPLLGNQDEGCYVRDEIYSIAQLLSGGGRFGYLFSEASLGRRFINFIVSGIEHLPFESLVHDKLNYRGIKEKVCKESQEKSVAGLYKRISTHDQYHIDGKFCEVKSYLKGIRNAYGMDFPIGGVGNLILQGDKRMVIGYEGALERGQYQLGTMLLKFDVHGNEARVMIGFESCAPYRKNPWGGNHGKLATFSKLFRGCLYTHIKKAFPAHDWNFLFKKGRTLTGQSKGREIGIFHSFGSNVAKMDLQKFERCKALYHALMHLGESQKKRIIQALLLSVGEKQRESVFQSICTRQTEKSSDRVLPSNREIDPPTGTILLSTKKFTNEKCLER